MSLSTDDEGIFGITIADECVKAVTHSDLTYAELRQMMLNSIDGAFLPDNEKAALTTRLKKKLTEFEKKWKDKLG